MLDFPTALVFKGFFGSQLYHLSVHVAVPVHFMAHTTSITMLSVSSAVLSERTSHIRTETAS